MRKFIYFGFAILVCCVAAFGVLLSFQGFGANYVIPALIAFMSSLMGLVIAIFNQTIGAWFSGFGSLILVVFFVVMLNGLVPALLHEPIHAEISMSRIYWIPLLAVLLHISYIGFYISARKREVTPWLL